MFPSLAARPLLRYVHDKGSFVPPGSAPRPRVPASKGRSGGIPAEVRAVLQGRAVGMSTGDSLPLCFCDGGMGPGREAGTAAWHCSAVGIP